MTSMTRTTRAVPALAALLLAPAVSAQSRAPGPPQVPLREGLTIVEAYHHPDRGDFEPIVTITRADADGVTATVSTDEPANCGARSGQGPGSQRTIARRMAERTGPYACPKRSGPYDMT